MHKKTIRGVAYYYTTIRENGRIKTIYLGRTRNEARKREAELKGIEVKPSPRVRIYFGLAVLIIFALFLGGAIVGYFVSVGPPGVIDNLTLELTFQAGDFLPKDIVLEVSLENQTSSLRLEEFLEKSGSGLALETNNFYSSEIQLAGSGEGYGIKGVKFSYPNVSFQFSLYNETVEENITLYNTTEELVLLESGIFNGSCSFENPYLANISNLIYQPGANYSVSLVPGSVRSDNKTLDDSYVFLELRGDLVIAETNYSEILEGYGEGFAGENRTFILNLLDLGMQIPEAPGTYTVITRIIYNGSVLEETSRGITLERKVTEDICTDNCLGKKHYTGYSDDVCINPVCEVGYCNAECDSNDDCGFGNGVCDTEICECSRVTDCINYRCLYIKDPSRSNVAIFDSAGDLDLKGTLLQNQTGPCSPSEDSFVIEDSSGNCRAYIDSSGNMWIDEYASEKQEVTCTCPFGKNCFIVKNSAGQCKAYIDSDGNLWLAGTLNQGADI